MKRFALMMAAFSIAMVSLAGHAQAGNPHHKNKAKVKTHSNDQQAPLRRPGDGLLGGRLRGQ